ncbi:small conductance mechanosensitive channel MscS [Aeropyrum pernix K1]|uniref:Small conductance mechanosensitive channel MscS n=1 Tax=Aeropyrum pernix (strain ATCC 700893 / DSM 11879 / JCM 9820 / NBRC 100138 / K1) TaxID=272557 RepID=Q9YC10_AERPE|nr:mechanosensitive ion channel family protein [Aeropyrum pernix]BAA80438.2 small conductance mechanosensitive channel MscS [Aeropyrum pernix K1]
MDGSSSDSISGLTSTLMNLPVERVALALVILALGLLASVTARRAIERYGSRVFPRDITHLLARSTYYMVLFLTAVAALQALGVELTALLVAGGFAGLVLSLALQPLFSNFFSGLYLYGEKSLVIGDLISIGGFIGRVVEISTMSTRVRTLDGEVVRIPNSRIINDYMVNYSKSAVRRLTFKASIAYREDIGKAINTISNALESIYLVLKDPSPEVYASELGDSGVIIDVKVWVPTDYWYQASMQVIKTVREALAREGIEIPFTQVDVWFRTPLEIGGKEG